MNRRGIYRTLLMSSLLAGATLATQSESAQAAAPLQSSCKLNSVGHKIQRVVHITFDNVHLTRDNPNVPSDLEQMLNLLNSPAKPPALPERIEAVLQLRD